MATKLTPKAPAKDKPEIKSRYIVKASSSYYDADRGIWDTEKKSWVFSINGDGMISCCGIHETFGFQFPMKKVEYSEELQTVFNEFISGGVLDDDGEPSLRYLVLNRSHGKDKANQPDWFIQCLENYPGATTLDWMANRNTNKSTDIKPYFLPIYA